MMTEFAFLFDTFFGLTESTIVLCVYRSKLRPRKKTGFCLSVVVQYLDRTCSVHAAYGWESDQSLRKTAQFSDPVE